MIKAEQAETGEGNALAKEHATPAPEAGQSQIATDHLYEGGNAQRSSRNRRSRREAGSMSAGEHYVNGRSVGVPVRQYRVIFKAWELVNGSFQKVEHSTKWFNTMREAIESPWMNQEGAKIAERGYVISRRPHN